MNRLPLRWFYVFFVASGFCSLTYEVVWLRLAMAAYGVNTPLVAIVLSVFMGGLALGSVAAGWISRRLEAASPVTPLRFYALAELLIGISSLAVPSFFEHGRGLLNAGGSAWGSGAYFLSSGILIALTLLPPTAFMGATIPLAMWAIRKSGDTERRAFSYLYMSNVLGATFGTVMSAFLMVELLGFRNSTRIAVVLNLLVAAAAWVLASRRPARAAPPDATTRQTIVPADVRSSPAAEPRRLDASVLLFTTGLMSLGMEVVWTRQFTPYLGTVVYAFAGTLALYLAATFLGSAIYRWWIGRSSRDLDQAVRVTLGAIAVTGVLPVLLSDPRLPLPLERAWAPVRVILGVVPFCAVVGFLSPLLVDRWSGGDPRRAGNAYAVNTVGCILGPLAASFLLLPFLSERWTILVFLAPAIGLGFLVRTSPVAASGRAHPIGRVGMWPAVLGIAIASTVALARDPEVLFLSRVVKRDSTATVVAATVEGRKHLFVNGQGMVYLTPVTKMMAHLPLAMRSEAARDGLVVCFGMGTSFRSVRSWGIPTTAVELVPSVPSLVGYFHADGDAMLASPDARVEIDDGRRFLERTSAQYDVITVDPPPPVEAAGSSLLYSLEWYALVKKRLRPGGVLQQWLPYGDLATLTAVARSLAESFPHVRIFNSFEGWGFHLVASMTPIPNEPAAVLAGRLPPAAAADLVELGPHATAQEQFRAVLDRELRPDVLLQASAGAPALTDDVPVNEYFLWRRVLRDGWNIYFSYDEGKFNPWLNMAPMSPRTERNRP